MLWAFFTYDSIFYAFLQYFPVRKHILQTKGKGQTHELNCKLLFLFLAPTHMSSDSYLKKFSKSRLCSMAYSAFTNLNIVVCRYA